MRGFTIERNDEGDMDEDGNESLRFQIRQEMIQKLASEWNATHRKIEERSWRSEESYDEEADYLADLCADAVYQVLSDAEEKNPDITEESLDELRAKAEADFYAEVDKKKRIDHERLDVIEELLGELGARMMRPYEHWNEDEKYMEYMEHRYDNQY
jgi:hypothetical protein